MTRLVYGSMNFNRLLAAFVYLCFVKISLITVLLMLSIAPLALGIQNASPTPAPTPAAEETPKPPKKLAISSGKAEELLLHKVNPKYPLRAREQNLQGDVVLKVSINKHGEVTDAKALSGQPILQDAAVDAVKQWRYKPYVLNGEAVDVETSVRVRFQP